MKRLRFELPTWDMGREFISLVSERLGAEIKEIEQGIRVETENAIVSCHFDERDFSFILVKYSDDSIENMIDEIKSQIKT